jgi:hypothetical protein
MPMGSSSQSHKSDSSSLAERDYPPDGAMNGLQRDGASESESADAGMCEASGLEPQDDMARIIMSLMKQNATEVGVVLKKRSMVIDSICWLSQHIPRRVLNDLLEEMAHSENNPHQIAKHPTPSSETPPVSSIEYHNEEGNPINHTGMHDTLQLSNRMEKLSTVDNIERSALPQDQDRNQRRASTFTDPFADSDDSQVVSVEVVPVGDPFAGDFLSAEKEYAEAAKSDVKCIGESNSLSDDSGDSSFRLGSRHGPSDDPFFLPRSKSSTIALLFVDISGFTKLSQVLDVENLSKVRSCSFMISSQYVLRFFLTMAILLCCGRLSICILK